MRAHTIPPAVRSVAAGDFSRSVSLLSRCSRPGQHAHAALRTECMDACTRARTAWRKWTHLYRGCRGSRLARAAQALPAGRCCVPRAESPTQTNSDILSPMRAPLRAATLNLCAELNSRVCARNKMHARAHTHTRTVYTII